MLTVNDVETEELELVATTELELSTLLLELLAIDETVELELEITLELVCVATLNELKLCRELVCAEDVDVDVDVDVDGELDPPPPQATSRQLNRVITGYLMFILGLSYVYRMKYHINETYETPPSLPIQKEFKGFIQPMP